MTESTFAALVPWVIAHGYFVFFVVAFLEGPVVTTAAGVGVALGYFSLPIIVLLSIAGDLFADLMYYAIGYWGGRPLLKYHGHWVGLTPARMDKLESLLHRHLGKTMIFVKLSPAIPIPGLLMIGSTKAPVWKFTKISLLITLPKSLLFVLIGFYSGKAYAYLSQTVTHVQYIFFLLVVAVFAVYFLYKLVMHYIASKINEEDVL